MRSRSAHKLRTWELSLIQESHWTCTHITTTCKAANYQLYQLNRIKKYRTPGALETAVHTLISSKLEYWNSLLVSLPTSQIVGLENIMNTSACLISGVKKFDHITSIWKTHIGSWLRSAPSSNCYSWLLRPWMDSHLNIWVICSNQTLPQEMLDLLINSCSAFPWRVLRSMEWGLLPMRCQVIITPFPWPYINRPPQICSL